MVLLDAHLVKLRRDDFDDQRTALLAMALVFGHCHHTSNEPRESLVLLISSLVDRRFYGTWTFPPYRFVHYNIVQSLAVFYGKNDWHYYLSQGLPLLLTTAAPFAAKGLWNALRPDVSGTVSTPLVRIRLQLAVTVIAVVAALSFISHKEVRFIYPLLPILHILSAESLTSFLWPLRSGTVSKQTLTGPRLSLSKGVLVMFLLSTNIAIALYATLVHQSGAISSLDYIRHRHEAAVATSETVSPRTTVGFLMPCHSTPWRSHLVHAGIEAWALGCEPPVGLNLEERTGYVDEADRFYLDPIAFARTEIADAASASRFRFRSIHGTGTRPSDGDLPDCLVFFQQLEGSMKEIVSSMERTAGGLPVEDGKGGYRECWRGFNSHWHDDWRRQGDVVAWCKSCNA
ncbi:MAG: glycosylphosphatidylinositol anchor biosynthesis [Thelocarpon impressellum]|nr:MAG: glycosylphosphatidylinositol anchor biosynthesis [Thelocarpon impressellum]